MPKSARKKRKRRPAHSRSCSGLSRCLCDATRRGRCNSVENAHIGYEQLIAIREALKIVGDCLPDKTTGLSKKQKRALRKRRRPSLAEPTNVAPVKLNPLKTAFMAVQRKLSPHLDEDGLEQAWEAMQALKSREDFRIEKSAKASGAVNVAP